MPKMKFNTYEVKMAAYYEYSTLAVQFFMQNL